MIKVIGGKDNMLKHEQKVARVVEQLKNRKSTTPVSLRKKNG